MYKLPRIIKAKILPIKAKILPNGFVDKSMGRRFVKRSSEYNAEYTIGRILSFLGKIIAYLVNLNIVFCKH